MLNAILRNKLERPEYRVLYDLDFLLTDPNFRQTIQSAVQNLRKNIRATGHRDDLAWKLEQFGNNGGWSLIKIKEFEKAIYDESKRPFDEFKGLARSIEFECIFNDQKSLEDFVRKVRGKGLVKWVTVKKDNSLRTDEDDKGRGLCKEVCVTYKAGDERILRSVCAELDTTAYVNNTCSTHVHFDMSIVPGATTPQEAEKQVKQYGNRLARCVPALKMILPKSRRNNGFCLNVINDIPRPGTPLAPANQIDKERYTFINLKSYRRFETIEVRGHSGTINAEKVLNWAALCEKIMTTRIRHKSVTHEIRNPLELIKIYKLDNKLANYVQDRFVAFNTAREREMFAIPAAREAQVGNADSKAAHPGDVLWAPKPKAWAAVAEDYDLPSLDDHY